MQAGLLGRGALRRHRAERYNGTNVVRHQGVTDERRSGPDEP